MRYPESRALRIGIAAGALSSLIVLQHSVLLLIGKGYLHGKVSTLASIFLQGPFGLWIYYQVSQTAWPLLGLLAILPLSGMSCFFLSPSRRTLAFSLSGVLSWVLLGMVSCIGLIP